MVKSYNFGTPTIYYEEKINDFRGVDLTSVESEVDKKRSPDSINMISTKNGLIEKRGGLSLYVDTPYTNIKSIYRFHMVAKGNYMGNYYQHDIDIDFIHAGTTIYWSKFSQYESYYWDVIYVEYSYSRELRTLSITDPLECNDVYYIPLKVENLGDSVLQKIYFFGNGFDCIIKVEVSLLDGNVYVSADEVISHAYIPTTVIARKPTGGGSSYEDISHLTWCRKNSFSGTAGTTTYQLDAKSLMAINNRYSTPFDGRVQAQILQSDGSLSTITEGSGLTVNRTTGVVTFSTAPGVSPVTGEDNVIITFAKNNWSGSYNLRDNIAGSETYYGSIFGLSSTYAFFGMNGQNNYLFASYENVDRYINLDTIYAPTLGYSYIGTNKTRIKGYSNMGSYLIIHKEESDEEPTIYLRSISLDERDDVVFPINNGTKGIGAIAKKSFQYLKGQPLFLSDDGVYIVESTNISYEQTIKKVSHYITNELKKVPRYLLQNAISSIYDEKYFLLINSFGTSPNITPTRVYVADFKQSSYTKDSSDRNQFEWYVWEFPMQVLSMKVVENSFTGDKKLFFTLSNGDILEYNTNVFVDYISSSTSVNVSAYWTTPVSFFNETTYKKSLKNVWIKLKRYAESGVDVSYRANGEVKNIGYKSITNADTTPEVIVTNRVEKQFMSIQLIFANYNNEPMGIIEIVSKFKYNAEYKGG